MLAALMGAHTIGRAQIKNSGYQGTWTTPQTNHVFDNEYYRAMILKGWGPNLAVGGDPNKNQFKRVD